MKKVCLIITALLLTIVAGAQTLNIQVGDVTYQFPAAQTGDMTYILLLAVYGVDTLLTIFHRILLRENICQAHRKHVYQIMANELNIPQCIVSIAYMMIQLIVSFGLILISSNHWIYALSTIIVLCAAYLLFIKRYYYLHQS